VSEGDPEYWAAVAGADGRVRELGWYQRELAECSRVLVAVVREIRRRYPSYAVRVRQRHGG
jgi:hypothetical protein